MGFVARAASWAGMALGIVARGQGAPVAHVVRGRRSAVAAAGSRRRVRGRDPRAGPRSRRRRATAHGDPEWQRAVRGPCRRCGGGRRRGTRRRTGCCCRSLPRHRNGRRNRRATLRSLRSSTTTSRTHPTRPKRSGACSGRGCSRASVPRRTSAHRLQRAVSHRRRPAGGPLHGEGRGAGVLAGARGQRFGRRPGPDRDQRARRRGQQEPVGHPRRRRPSSTRAVVAFDPDRDVAILHVDPARPFRRCRSVTVRSARAGSGRCSAIRSAGRCSSSPFEVAQAVDARGFDIYDQRRTTRQHLRAEL